jgi:hypothetical protein
MSVELFDQDADPTLKVVLEIYDTDDDFIPNWWLEVDRHQPVTRKHLRGVLLSLPSIERQIEKLIDLLDETE